MTDAILIAGPTASGKSAAALALATRLGGTVILPALEVVEAGLPPIPMAVEPAVFENTDPTDRLPPAQGQVESGLGVGEKGMRAGEDLPYPGAKRRNPLG